jgi:LacI family transcriptional regulator
MDPIRYVVETGSADGIIFSATRENDPRVAYLMARNFPMVSHGRTGLSMDHAFFDFDNAAFARIGVELLSRRGRTRIALLPPPPELYYAHHMTQGFVAAMAEHDLQEVPLRTVSFDQPLDLVREEVERAMASRHRPDGIICGNGSSALTAAAAVEGAGLKIGRDVDLVTKHSEQVIRLIRPEIIVINEDFRRAGVMLARSLIAAIGGEDPRKLQYLDTPA